MRDALGALGPVDGNNPELNNLTVAMTIVDQGDIVFLTSDGISDNFDPVVGKFAAVPRRAKPSAGSAALYNKQVSNECTTTDANNHKQQATNNKPPASAKKISASTNGHQPQSMVDRITASVHRKKSAPAAANDFFKATADHLTKKLPTAMKISTNSSSTNNSSADNSQSQPPQRGAVNLRRTKSNHDRPSNCLPYVSAEQRYELLLLRMEDVLTNGLEGSSPKVSCSSARKLCDLLIEFATKLTTAKRRVLEDPDLYNADEDFDAADQRRRRRKVGAKLADMPGKLDHASVVAYKVGFRGSLTAAKYENDVTDDKKYNLKLIPTLARFDSSEDFGGLEFGPI